MIVHAGHKRIAACDAVDEAVVAQEIQRPVNRDRRRPGLGAKPLDDLVGAERLMTCEQSFQHLVRARSLQFGVRAQDDAMPQ